VSSRITEILSVLRILRRVPPAMLTFDEVRRRRIDATKEVAETLGITHETVRDALTRQLHPHVVGIRAFDSLVRVILESCGWRVEGMKKAAYPFA
jgi:hypothetical protein